MPKPIAVAVLNWNGRALLEAYLSKLVEDSQDLGTVYVIDNASSDDSLEWMRRNTPEVKIIELESNYGYAGGYNKGLAQIEEEFVVLINSDIESTPGWLEPLLKRFEADEKLAALQPKILDLKDRSNSSTPVLRAAIWTISDMPFAVVAYSKIWKRMSSNIKITKNAFGLLALA